ncbi:hypothetical protein [Streptomyces sp. CMSTAAHL-2]|nr:hypothetical protein [Streptomyces sp. CMSTAAHL-2]MCE3032082.1 hypothetical protein [Streptomyces sp. CMSTAAHL-2]
MRITLQSVGPGPAPAAASFSVALDPQVVSDIRITAARLNHKAHDAGVRIRSQTLTSSLFETRCRTKMKLKPGDQLDLDLEVRTRKLTGDLPTIKHPSVGLIDMGNHVAQRLSWWIPWQIRWRLLATASVISVLCVVIAFLGFMSKKPINSNEIGCDPIARCTDWRPLYWLEAGVISFACCMALTVVTFVVEKIAQIRCRTSA